MANIVNFKGGSTSGVSLSGDALPEEVLEGKTFYSEDSVKKTGTLENVESLIPYDLVASPAKYQLVAEPELTNLELRNWAKINVQCTNVSWQDICYGNGKFVAIAYDHLSLQSVVVSEDGINWSIASIPIGANWSSIFYAEGIFVIISYDSAVMIKSPDAVTWTSGGISSTGTWTSLTHNGTKFIAVSDTGEDILYSNDMGNTWRMTTAMNGKFKAVCYGNGILVAVGIADFASAAPTIMTSTDSMNWTGRADPDGESAKWRSICYGMGLFVAVGDLGKIMTSSDGITWTKTVIEATMMFSSIICANGMFIAITNSGSYNIAYSYNGIDWIYCNVYNANSSFVSLAEGKGRLIIVKDDEASAIFFSADFYKV